MADPVLVVSNDFPPVVGGIETFTAVLSAALTTDREVIVLTRAVPGAPAGRTRAAAGPVVVRVARSPLLPTPGVSAVMSDLIREHHVGSVWFASAAPLGLLAPAARRAGAVRIIASTHGHETWWARTPGAATALRRIAATVDALTVVSDWTGRRLAPVAPATGGREPLVRLAPGVDTAVFAPDPAARLAVRQRLGVVDEPVVLAASRLVRRKGHDVLLAAWPGVRAGVPAAQLVVVGDGPDRHRIARLAAAAGGRRAGVHLVGEQSWASMPAWYAAADAFALPVRTRWGGLEPEALGICFLEAAAAGLPVVVGRSGGTPETVADGCDGVLVNGRDRSAVTAAVVNRLSDLPGSARQGRRGRRRVMQEWTWQRSATTLRALLDGTDVRAADRIRPPWGGGGPGP